jgi:hypothetical protein
MKAHLWLYLDENFIHTNLVANKMIVYQNNLPNGLKLAIGKGSRYSIIDVGLKTVLLLIQNSF